MTATPPPSDRERDTLLMHAAIDGELDPANALALEQRIAADPALAAERARIEALRQALHDKLPLEEAPAALRARIRDAVGLTAARPASGFSRRVTWQALAASVVCAAVLSSGGTWYTMRATPGDEVAEAVLASHLRSLMAPQPIDVASSDRHTVKPWFAGRTDLSPPAIDLGAEGFPLVGGRLDLIAGQPVPALVYKRGQHVINLFVLPASRGGRGEGVVRRGYNLRHWDEGDLGFWVVTDASTPELAEFERLFRTAAKG